jgi:hypothetical protein
VFMLLDRVEHECRNCFVVCRLIHCAVNRA